MDRTTTTGIRSLIGRAVTALASTDRPIFARIEAYELRAALSGRELEMWAYGSFGSLGPIWLDVDRLNDIGSSRALGALIRWLRGEILRAGARRN
jgi:hypothetical protein